LYYSVVEGGICLPSSRLPVSYYVTRVGLFHVPTGILGYPTLLAACQHVLLSWNTLHVGLEGTDTVTPIKNFQKDASLRNKKYNLAPDCASRQVHEANTYPLKLATLYGPCLVSRASGGMHPVVASVFHSIRNKGLKY